jgi:hypothetical protein
MQLEQATYISDHSYTDPWSLLLLLGLAREEDQPKQNKEVYYQHVSCTYVPQCVLVIICTMLIIWPTVVSRDQQQHSFGYQLVYTLVVIFDKYHPYLQVRTKLNCKRSSSTDWVEWFLRASLAEGPVKGCNPNPPWEYSREERRVHAERTHYFW